MWGWVDAGQAKEKPTPVLCQALTELGLENNVLIQLQIRLDRNVRELVWIQFWLEEKPPSIPIQSPPQGSLACRSTSQGARHRAVARHCHTTPDCSVPASQ